MDIEELEQAIVEGDLTKKPFTSRISNLRKQQLNWLAIFLKAEKKLKARLTIEEALDFAIELAYESKLQEFSKPPKNDLAKPLQSSSISQGSLQVASTLQMDEPIQQAVPLQNENKKQTKINGMTIEEIQRKAKEPIVAPFKINIAKSKQEKKQDNVIEFTPSKVKLLDGIFANE